MCLFLAFGVFFFDGDAVDVVVGAEWDNFQIWRDVVDDASAYAVDVKVVAVHKSHAAQKENAATDFAQRLIRGGDMHPQYALNQGEGADFSCDKQHIHRQHRAHEKRGEQGQFPFGFGAFSGFSDVVEEAVEVDEAVDGKHFAFGRNVNPVYDAALWAATEEGPGFLHEFTHDFDGGSHN